jgi:nicotinate-nucleotide--dimethylbenzimidazole phosphoribosyltransferase
MTTGTDEFGPAEFGADDQFGADDLGSPLADREQGAPAQSRPIPAQPGPQPGLPPRQQADYAHAGYGDPASAAGQSGSQPGSVPGSQPGEQMPWLSGNSVGYAEAMFGSGQQATAQAGQLGSSGPRPQTVPQQGGPQQSVPHQGIPRATVPPQGVPRQAAPQPLIPHPVVPQQGASHDAPTTEFFPGPIFDKPSTSPQSHAQPQQPDHGVRAQHAVSNGHWTARPAEPEQPVQSVQAQSPLSQSPLSQPPLSQPLPRQAASVQPPLPPRSQSINHEPVNHEPVNHEPVNHEPIDHEPIDHEASYPEAVHSEPSRPEPDHPEPVQQEPPLHAEQFRTQGPDTMTPPRRAGSSVSGLGGRSARSAPIIPPPFAAAPQAQPQSQPQQQQQPQARQLPQPRLLPQPRAASHPESVAAQLSDSGQHNIPQAIPEPVPQSHAQAQAQNQTVPQPPVAPMSVAPMAEQSPAPEELEDADELIVPWQALAVPVQAQPLPAESLPPEPMPDDSIPDELITDETLPAQEQPVESLPSQVQPVEQPPVAETVSAILTPAQPPVQPVVQQPVPPPVQPPVQPVAPTAEAPAVVTAPAAIADDAPQEDADQAPDVVLIPRGTRRRSAQQYLADEQEQTVQQPVQQPAKPLAQPPFMQPPVQSSAQPLAQPPARQSAQSRPASGQQRQKSGQSGPQPSPSSQVAQTRQPDPLRAPGYDHEALAAVYRVIHERRDVRNDFLTDPIPTEMLTRILEAAHTAPSVGFSQPWDFLVIRDRVTRESIHDLAVRQRRAYAASLPKARAKAFAALKTEAILDTPINIVVTCDPTRGGRHTLGRYSQPLMAPFSSCLAVENLWLAARAEGLGVGWVSFFDERELAAVLDLPGHVQIVAYLCVGFVKQFPTEPELIGSGWAQRRPLSWAVHEETFGHRAMPGAEPISLLNETIDAIRPLDPAAVAQARDRQNRMTKPPGSLGALEAVGEQLAGLAGICPPPMPEPAALAIFAGDHGVHAQGVTPWPQAVTAQMVGNFLAGGAVINAFAKQVGAEVCVVDIGVAADLSGKPGLVPRKIRYGTADMTQGPAMSRSEAVEAVEAGIETARDLIAAGNRCLLTGDMGIANTTASAALIATFTGASPAQVTGYGTGIDEQTYAHKVEVVHRALQLHQPDPQDPIGVLAAFGGLEHAALAGFILGAAALRVPVILDGVIAGAAALVAQALAPDVTAACVAGHRSAEPGHALALEALEVMPLIDLELRLGEGSGAALALPLVGAAVRALREVATFDDAGVAEAAAPGPGAIEAAQRRSLPSAQPAQARALLSPSQSPQLQPVQAPASRPQPQQQPQQQQQQQQGVLGVPGVLRQSAPPARSNEPAQSTQLSQSTQSSQSSRLSQSLPSSQPSQFSAGAPASDTPGTDV